MVFFSLVFSCFKKNLNILLLCEGEKKIFFPLPVLVFPAGAF